MVGVATRVWNFVLTGNVRCGASAVISSINNYGGAVCHIGLFDPNDEVRKASHVSYFGESSDGQPQWCIEGQTNPWQYLNASVLDRPMRGESAVGVHLSYADVARFDLFDLFEQRGRAGDFSVVHVVRNPVACFVSFKQATQSGLWHRTGNQAAVRPPSPVRLDPTELVAFCTAHDIAYAKTHASCVDRFEISYHALVVNFQTVMAEVFDFLELPPKPVLAHSTYRRLKNRLFSERVVNWSEVRALVPTHVRRQMDADDLV